MRLFDNFELVFIVGCQRTGTTLIGNVLGAHPQAFLIDEPDGLYPWMESVFSSQDSLVTNALFLKCCLKARNSYLDPDIKCDDEGNLSTSITHLILKAPNLTYSADKITEHFAKPLCIFAYRDIRDVVVSMSKLKFVPMVQNQLVRIKANPAIAADFSRDVAALENPDTQAHQARAYVAKIKTELRGTFNQASIQKLEVCYEDMVQQPDLWKNKLLRHVQLPTDHGLDHTDVMTGWGPGLNYRLNKINTFSIGQWQHYLSTSQEDDVWRIVEPVMSDLGYSREIDSSSTNNIWDNIVSDYKAQPIIATGRGGSGTRLLSQMLKAQGVFLGNKVNKMGDSLEWVSLLYKIAIEHTQAQTQNAFAQWRLPLRETAAEILTRGNWSHDQPWGWKLPETMLALPEIFDTFSQGKLIHLVRHPVDSSLRRDHMTSRVSNLVGKTVLQAAYSGLGWSIDRISSDPAYLRNAASWLYQVSEVSRFGAEVLGSGRYLEIRYEDFCLDPSRVSGLISDFLEIQIPGRAPEIEIDQKRCRNWNPPDPRADEVWEICGVEAKNLGYQKY